MQLHTHACPLTEQNKICSLWPWQLFPCSEGEGRKRHIGQSQTERFASSASSVGVRACVCVCVVMLNIALAQHHGQAVVTKRRTGKKRSGVSWTPGFTFRLQRYKIDVSYLWELQLCGSKWNVIGIVRGEQLLHTLLSSNISKKERFDR